MSDSIGEKLKQVRNAKGMTLKELGDIAGLSAGYLSQLERGKSSIGMSQLGKLANCLGVDVRYFISEEFQSENPVMKSYENVVLYIENERSFQYRITNDLHSKDLLPRIDVLLPGFSTEAAHTHGGEEFIYVLEGVMTVGIDGKVYELYPGDTAHYSATTVHSWSNNTSKPVRVLLVTTPNSFKKDPPEEE